MHGREGTLDALHEIGQTKLRIDFELSRRMKVALTTLRITHREKLSTLVN
jgi:hypothetical protein